FLMSELRVLYPKAHAACRWTVCVAELAGKSTILVQEEEDAVLLERLDLVAAVLAGLGKAEIGEDVFHSEFWLGRELEECNSLHFSRVGAIWVRGLWWQMIHVLLLRSEFTRPQIVAAKQSKKRIKFSLS